MESRQSIWQELKANWAVGRLANGRQVFRQVGDQGCLAEVGSSLGDWWWTNGELILDKIDEVVVENQQL